MDPNMPLSLGPGHAGVGQAAAPSAYWGDRQLWDTRFNNHNAMFDKDGPGVVLGLASAAATIRPGARRARTIRRPRCSRSTRAAARSRCSIPRPRSSPSSTPASAPIICSSATTPTTRCGCRGTGQVAGWINTKSLRRDRRRRRSRRAGRRSCSTPTATASSTTSREPGKPMRPARTCASTAAPAPTR